MLLDRRRFRILRLDSATRGASPESLTSVFSRTSDLRPESFATAGIENGSHHCVPTIQALEAGVHVLVEKPISNDIVEAVRMVRAKGLRTAIVTNNIREYGDTWRNQFPLDELFDAVVDSHEIGVRKPDPRIFEHALGLLGGVAPERAVFLDVGITGHQQLVAERHR